MVFFYGSHEPTVEDLIRQHVGAESVAIDVGANVGVHSLVMASRGATVLAIEPNPIVYRRLLSNIDLNGFTNIRAQNIAISDSPGELCFSFPASDETNQGSGAVMSGGNTRVPAVTLDRLVEIEGLDRVDFLKIDVEGWEPAVLAGAEQVVAKHRPLLVFEHNAYHWRRTGGDITAVLGALRAWGYSEFYTVHDRRGLISGVPQNGNVCAR